jgi:hypothetical protein
MSAQEHLERFFSAWSLGDPDRMTTFYARDCVMRDATFSGPLQGSDAIRAYYASMFASLEAPEHDLVAFAAHDGRVWFHWTFVHGGVMKPRVTHQGVSIHTLGQDGLILADESFWNPAEPGLGAAAAAKNADSP